MRPQYGFLCTRVEERPDGTVNVEGLGLGVIRAARHEPHALRNVLAIICEFDLLDNEVGEHLVSAVLETPSGRQSELGDRSLAIPPALAGATRSALVSLNIKYLPISAVGEHTVRVFVDGLELIALPLFVNPPE